MFFFFPTIVVFYYFFFFFQAEDGIRDLYVTGVQTCALPISDRAYLLFLPIFFTSGFAALLYQMIWQRFLTFFSGADVDSVTLIVAAFMGGLGFGSLAGGHLADRLSPRGRFLTFAASELAIAAFAFLSVPLLYDLLFLRLGTRPLPGPLLAAVLFVVLLWPTFFMGLSLPLLARVLTDRPGRSAERIGGLYGWNTLGAALGSLVTVWVLARTVGFEQAIRIGAFLNLGCAGMALLVVFGRSGGRTAAAPADPVSGAPGSSAAPPAP